MLIIGPPSNAKTELLRALDEYPDAVFVSTLTDKTIVSGLKPKAGMPDPSLIHKLDGRTMVLKDFTSVLSMRPEKQAEILGQLRELYDGKYNSFWGNGKVIDWRGHVGLLGACTPVYDKHYGVIGSLGDRFLLYRTEECDAEAMAHMAQSMVGRDIDMRAEIRDAVHKFLHQFQDVTNLHFEVDVRSNAQIVSLACFCAYGRTAVDRNYRDRTIEYEPLPEGTARLTKQFMQIGMALALIHDKDRIDGEIYEIVKKIGRDLLPGRRLSIIRELFHKGCTQDQGAWMKTGEIADRLNVPTNTAKMTAEDLMVVRVLQRDRDGEKENSPYRWRLTRDFSNFIQGAEVFEETTNEPF